jgi:acyl-CoA dehydrogenase
MIDLIAIFIILVALIFVSYKQLGLRIFTTVSCICLLLAVVASVNHLIIITLTILVVSSSILSNKTLRLTKLTPVLFQYVKKMLPPLSETERVAIDAGTVWWDGELYSGAPDWNRLIKIDAPCLSSEEKTFIEGPVTELCRMTNVWEINNELNMIPDQLVQFVRDNGFLGMIIPKQYGGLALSAVAQSEVLIKLSNCGAGITYLVGVPNSLGPSELLIHYGTEEQKEFYLPRLASGKEIPCFALTAPSAGSDATSIPDIGTVCKGQWEGKEITGIRLNFSKRYITLAPIATLIGLAFKLNDPDHLIGNIDEYGITCALLPRETIGMKIGPRHLPIGDTFINGPVEGKDVFIPLEYIIGGTKMAGNGWRMLVNCLSVGRCITLPTSATSLAKRMVLGTTAYASLRNQFGLPLKDFEGIQKPLARMIGRSYIINAASKHTIQSVDNGEKPSVASAIIKYHCTEMARQCAIDAMDIHGGKAVMKGPKNYIADCYESVPVYITVEGANILTRNFMIFGQGVMRSHPYVLKEIELAQHETSDEIISAFDNVLFKHIEYCLSNVARSFAYAITGSRISHNPGHDRLERYYALLNRFSAAFAVVSDISIATQQSKLKFMENLSARLGDLLSNLYLASMVIKEYENNDCPVDEFPVVQWSLEHLLHNYQEAFRAILQNYPNRPIALLIKLIVFPLGMNMKPPGDELEKTITSLLTQNNQTRDRLTAGLYLEAGDNNPLAHVNAVFLESIDVEPLLAKIRQAQKDKILNKSQGIELIKAAHDKDIIMNAEANKLKEFDQHLMDVINVDVFKSETLINKLQNGNSESLTSDTAFI